MNDLFNLITLAGAFIPVIGVLATVLLGIVLTGRNRWKALFLCPLISFVISATLNFTDAYSNWELMAAIPAMLTFFLAIACVIYYPILLILLIVVKRRQPMTFPK